MKVVYNDCYGSFSVSVFGMLNLIKRKGWQNYIYKHIISDKHPDYCQKVTLENLNKICPNSDSYSIYYTNIDLGDTTTIEEVNRHSIETMYDYNGLRFDHDLIALIEEYGSERISGSYAELAVYEVPKGCLFRIDSYDGNESIEIENMDDDMFYAYE